MCDKGYMWNPSTCACECDKYCEIGQYLDYKNWVCRKKLIDDLMKQCTSVVDMEVKKNGTDLLPVTMSSDNRLSGGTNVYLFLFVTLLRVVVLLVVGFIYYCRKENSKKVDDKIYDVAYSASGTLGY